MSVAAQRVEALDHFSNNRLFEGIRPEVLEDVAHELRIVRLDEGEVIFREGDRGGSLYLVGRGSVHFPSWAMAATRSRSPSSTGNFFGEMACSTASPFRHGDRGRGSTLLGTVTDQTFQHILALAPSRLHVNFLRSVSERLRHVNSRFITEVMRTERLGLVGSMANSIIHDLKNPISIIRCCADLIASEKQRSAPARVDAMQNKAVDGMISMTQELLDYARGSTALVKEHVSIGGFDG